MVLSYSMGYKLSKKEGINGYFQYYMFFSYLKQLKKPHKKMSILQISLSVFIVILYQKQI